MALHPIAVKRKRKSPGTSSIPRALTNTNMTDKDKDKDNEKELDTAADSSSPDDVVLLPRRIKQRCSLHHVLERRTKHPRPTLDTLPLDVLELIHLHAMNLALPRASGRIGARLSGKATLIRTVIQAFADIWASTEGVLFLYCNSAMPMDASIASLEIQSAVLAERWATIDILLQAQQRWVTQNGRPDWRLRLHTNPYSTEGGITYASIPAPPCAPTDLDDNNHELTARECFLADYSLAQAGLVANANAQVSAMTPLSVPHNPYRHLDLHPFITLPTRLLSGPWDEEARQRIYWLKRGGLTFPAGFTVSWEVRRDFIENAILRPYHLEMLVAACLIDRSTWGSFPVEVATSLVSRLRNRLQTRDYAYSVTAHYFITWVMARIAEDAGLPVPHLD